MRKIGGYTYNGEIRLFWIEEILVIFTSFIYIYLFFSFFFVLPFVQIPFRVLYNCLYIFFFITFYKFYTLHFIHFPFHFFLIFIFPLPNYPHSLHFFLISRFSFLSFSPSLVYYSFFFLPLPSPSSPLLWCSCAAARVYIHANILLEVRARASGSRSHLFVTGRPVQAGLFQVNARSCATRYLRPFSFSLLPKYELYSLFWAFVSAIATRRSIDNRVSTVWNRAHIFGAPSDLLYPCTIISSFIGCFVRNSGILWLIVTRD